MAEAVIIDAVRTAGGKRGGLLKGWHPVDLAAEVLEATVSRSSLDPALVDDVILGCVSQTGEQSVNVARNAVLAAGFPDTVPGVTLDRQCGSSQQAVHFAAQGVIAGAYDVVIAGGVEAMTRVPMGVTMQQGPGQPFGPALLARYDLVPQGISAELIAEKWGITRTQADQLAYDSHMRAVAASDAGHFDDEIIPIQVKTDNGDRTEMRRDEGIRPDTTMERLGELKPAFREGGIVTAGNSSQITDGASAVLVMSREKADQLGLRPRAAFTSFAVVGVDPITMLTGPIPATERALARARLTIDDIDRFEVNEAFATVVAAWLAETGADWARTNVNGGAMALGHPLGASGTKLMATLLNELERTGGRFGLQTMCEGGGMANATIIERLD